jgi:hypothetical protein
LATSEEGLKAINILENPHQTISEVVFVENREKFNRDIKLLHAHDKTVINLTLIKSGGNFVIDTLN